MTIFFDVDGVLNCEADWQRPFTINKRCVRAFAHIVEKLQKRELVQLVIISTWRAGIGKEDDSPQMKNHYKTGLTEADVKPVLKTTKLR